MFSGVLPGAANVARYAGAWGAGCCVIAVRPESDAAANVATAILERSGPRVYSLPNAPSAWNEASAGDPASIGGVDRDPAQPGGLLEGAEGLSVDGDRARLARAPRR